MHDIFSLPEDGYPQDLLPIRQEIVNRTASGQINAAYDMYQYELSRLKELEIPVFELPREYFELEQRLRWSDSKEDGSDPQRDMQRMAQLLELAGVPRQRIDDPTGAGLPDDLRAAWQAVEQAVQEKRRDDFHGLMQNFVRLQTRYGILEPDLRPEITEDEEFSEAAQENEEVQRSFRLLHKAISQAVFRGEIDKVMELQEQLMQQAAELDQPFRRMPREFYELQHDFSQAARRNDEAELARLQLKLQEMGNSSDDTDAGFDDPVGLIRLPPAYSELFEECEEAFRKGNHARALQISLKMQQMLESSADIFNLINTGEDVASC